MTGAAIPTLPCHSGPSASLDTTTGTTPSSPAGCTPSATIPSSWRSYSSGGRGVHGLQGAMLATFEHHRKGGPLGVVDAGARAVVQMQLNGINPEAGAQDRERG